jgi:hypothetical protein
MNKNEWIILVANKVIFAIVLIFALCLKLLDVVSVIGTFGTLTALLFGVKLACLQFQWQWFELFNRSNRVLCGARDFLADAERSQGNKELWNRSFFKFRTEYFDNHGLLQEAEIIKDRKYMKDLLHVSIELHTALGNAEEIFKPYIDSKSLFKLRTDYDFNVRMKELNPDYIGGDQDIMCYQAYLMNHNNSSDEIDALIQDWRQKITQFRHLVYSNHDRFELYKKVAWSWRKTWECLTWGLFKKKQED